MRDELGHPRRRLEPELVAQQRAETLVLRQCLPLVSLGEMDADHESLCALAQRLRADRGLARFCRLAVPPCVEQPLAESLEGVNAELPVTLALERHPVVVPVREQVVAQEEVVRARALLA